MAPSMACLNNQSKAKKPIVSFGVITDIQYADIDDRLSFFRVPRHYRHSRLILRRAVQKWNDDNLKFAINLGDIVDGYCPRDQSLTTVKKIVNEFNQFNGPVHHVIGNHCLSNLGRDDLLEVLSIPGRVGFAYYDFSPVPEYRFVFLDGYDISTIGWPENHPNRIKANNFLRAKNPNSNKNCTDGLEGLEKRFVKFNGAIGKHQLEWLDRVLQSATKLNQKVIICCHMPLNLCTSYNREDPSKKSYSYEALVWNYVEVMDVIHRYTCVKVCLAGHDHKGGESVDSHGVHHWILEAALECPEERNPFGRVDLHDDRVVLTGTDWMKSHEAVFTS